MSGKNIYKLCFLISILLFINYNLATDVSLQIKSDAGDLNEELLSHEDPEDQESSNPITCVSKFKEKAATCFSRTGDCLKRNKQKIAIPVMGGLTTLLDLLTVQKTGQTADTTVQQEFANRISTAFEKVSGFKGYKGATLVRALMLFLTATGFANLDYYVINPMTGMNLAWGPAFGLAAFYTIINELKRDDLEKLEKLYKTVESLEAEVKTLKSKKKKKSKKQPEESKREAPKTPDKGDAKQASESQSSPA